jgi:hypothetical protein
MFNFCNDASETVERKSIKDKRDKSGDLKRKMFNIHLNKERRLDLVTKRRHQKSTNDDAEEKKQQERQDYSKEKFIEEKISTFRFIDNNQESKLEAITEIRKSVSNFDKNVSSIYIDLVLSTDLVDEIIDSILGKKCNLDILSQFVWILLSIAAGSCEQTRLLVDKKCIQALHFLLECKDSLSLPIVRDIVWCLDNIVCDEGRNYRDMIFKQGFVPILAEIGNQVYGLYTNDESSSSCDNKCDDKCDDKCKNNAKEFLESFAFLMYAICQDGDEKTFDYLKPILPILSKLITLPDKKIIHNVIKSLSKLSNDNTIGNSKIEVLTSINFCARLIQLLSYNIGDDEKEIIFENKIILKTLLNISSGSNKQTASLTENKLFMPTIKYYLTAKNKYLRKYAFHILSNIVSESISKKCEILNHNLLPIIVNSILKDKHDVSEDAAWAFYNFLDSSQEDEGKRENRESEYLLVNGCRYNILTSKEGIKIICDTINKNYSNKLLFNLLEVIKNFYVSTKITSEISTWFEESGGLDNLETVEDLFWDDKSICDLVAKIKSIFSIE